jgi:5,10-methylenetetrahydrofolate reductase
MTFSLKEQLSSGRFLSLEVTPLHGLGVDILAKRIETTELVDKVNAFVVTDNPLARLKSNSIIAAYKLQERFHKAAIATMTMRDRNKIALQADLLGANELGIDHILALTGDSAKASDQPNVKGVFEGNSLLLLEMIKCFNAGLDYGGKPFIHAPSPINAFAVVPARANNTKTLYKKMTAKLRYAPLGLITQPVYSIDDAKALMELFDEAKAEHEGVQSRLVLGFFPVTRLRTAQFLNSHVPGVQIPREWMTRLEKAKKKSEEAELAEGEELSSKLFGELMSYHPSLHIMGANNFTLLDKLTKGA